MTVIIVDDEPKAIELLRSYLSHFANFELKATFRNGLKALAYLNAQPVDLVLLDINMPHLNGLSFAKMIDKKTKVIFTTAYAEYAVESYEVQAVDYLLKPISLERFSKAITKMFGSTAKAEVSYGSSEEKQLTLLVKSGTKVFRVNAMDVLFLVKDGNYITYHTRNQKIVARASVGETLAELPGFFLQTHKSYIINTQQIEFVDRHEISINDQLIPIGGSFKEEVLRICLGLEEGILKRRL